MKNKSSQWIEKIILHQVNKLQKKIQIYQKMVNFYLSKWLRRFECKVMAEIVEITQIFYIDYCGSILDHFLFRKIRRFPVEKVKWNKYEILKDLLSNSVLSISFELIISSFMLSKSMSGMKNMRNWSPNWKYMSHKLNNTLTSILAANKLRNQTWA